MNYDKNEYSNSAKYNEERVQTKQSKSSLSLLPCFSASRSENLTFVDIPAGHGGSLATKIGPFQKVTSTMAGSCKCFLQMWQKRLSSFLLYLYMCSYYDRNLLILCAHADKHLRGDDADGYSSFSSQRAVEAIIAIALEDYHCLKWAEPFLTNFSPRDFPITCSSSYNITFNQYITLLNHNSNSACLHAMQNNRFHKIMSNYQLSNQDCTNLLFINYINQLSQRVLSLIIEESCLERLTL